MGKLRIRSIARTVPQHRIDEWQNVLTGLGQGARDAQQATLLTPSLPMGQGECDAAYAEDPLYARMVDAIPEHATRRWIGVTADADSEGGGDPPEDFGRQALDALEDLRAQEKFCEWMRLDRKDGGSLMLLGADDGRALDQPLNMDAVKTLTHLHVIERWCVRPGMLGVTGEYDTDFLSPTFGEPLYYYLLATAQTASKGDKVHRSRVFPLHGIKVSELNRLSYGGWGQPVIHRAREAVRRFRELLGHLGAAVKHISQPVFRIAGMRDLMAEEDGDANLTKMLQDMQKMRSTIKGLILDKEDEFQEVGLSLAGLADLVKMIMDDVAASAEMPLSVLFGHSPQGFSSDDVPGKRNFYDSIALKQRRLMLHPLNTLIEIMRRASDGPLAGLGDGFRVQVDFLPLEEPTDQERATTRKLEADTDVALVNAGILDVMESRSRYHADPRNPYDLSELAPPKPEPTLDPALAFPKPAK